MENILFLAISIGMIVSMWIVYTKAGQPGWASIIPIYNMYILITIAKKPGWWLILMFIPIINIVFGILIWMGIAEAMGHPSWWGILIIVPFVNLVVPGYLAWAAPSQPPAQGAHPGQPPYAQPPGGQPPAGSPPPPPQ